MYYLLKKNWDKARYIIISGFVILFLLLLTAVYKSDEKIVKRSETFKNSYKVID